MGPETDLIEVVEIVVRLAARQAATLKLLRQSGLDPKMIDEYLHAAERQIEKIPVVQEVLAKRRLPPPGSLGGILKSLRWDL